MESVEVKSVYRYKTIIFCDERRISVQIVRMNPPLTSPSFCLIPQELSTTLLRVRGGFPRRFLRILVTLGLLFLTNFAHATTYYWEAASGTDGGTGTWTTSGSNWSTTANGTSPVAWPNGDAPNGDLAIFAGSAGTMTVSGTINVGTLQFGVAGSTAGGYTLQGGTLALSGANLIDVTNITTTPTLAIASNLTSSGTVTFLGKGTGVNTAAPVTVTLSGNNSGVSAMNFENVIVSVTAANSLAPTVTVAPTASNPGQTKLNLAGGLAITSNITLDATNGYVYLENTGSTLTTVSGNISLAASATNSIELENSGAGGLTLSGNITSSGSGGAVTFRGNTSGVVDTVSGTVNLGTNTFAKTDGGTWLIATTGNTWGTTTIQGGASSILRVGITNALPTSTNVIIGSGTTGFGTLDLNGFNQTIAQLNTAGTVFTSDIVTNTGGNATTSILTVTNGGIYSGVINQGIAHLALTLTGGTLQLAGTAANTYTGLTSVTGGELDLDKSASTLSIDSSTIDVSGTGLLKLLTSNQILSSATADVTGGTLNFNGQSQTLASVVNTGGTVIYGGSGGSGTVTVSDPTWQTGGINTVSGLTTFTDGLIVTGGTNTITGGSTGGQGELTLQSSTALAFTGASAPTIIIDGDSSTPTSLPGIVKLEGNVTADGASTATIGTTSGTQSGELDLETASTSSARVFTVGGTTTPGLLVSAQIIDSSASPYGLTKAGTGIMTVTGANTYGGGTTVSAGGLYVNNASGSGTGSGAVQVNSGGTLGGSGKIAGAVTVNTMTSTAATLASGAIQTSYASINGGNGLVNGTGTGGGLTLSSTLTVNGGSSLTFALGSNVNVNGGFNVANPNMDSTYLTVGGSGDIFSNTTTADNISLMDLTVGSTTATLTLRTQGAYLLIAGTEADFSNLYTTGAGNTGNGYVLGVDNGSGGYTAFNLEVVDANGTRINSSTNYQGLQLYLYNGNLEVVPEPGTWALMLGGLALLVVIQRRRDNN